MGKYYTIIRNNLYVYTTGKDTLLPPSDLPPSLGLLDPKQPWKWTNRIAVSYGLPDEALKQAAVILEIYGYEMRFADEEALEHYLITQDERYLGPEEHEYVSMLRKLHIAFKEGRISKDVYVQEVEILGKKLEAEGILSRDEIARLMKESMEI